MFGKLKQKLKESLSVFSKKTTEEAEDIPEEKVKEVLEKTDKAKDKNVEKVKEAEKEEKKKEAEKEKKREEKEEKKKEKEAEKERKRVEKEEKKKVKEAEKEKKREEKEERKKEKETEKEDEKAEEDKGETITIKESKEKTDMGKKGKAKEADQKEPKTFAGGKEVDIKSLEKESEDEKTPKKVEKTLEEPEIKTEIKPEKINKVEIDEKKKDEVREEKLKEEKLKNKIEKDETKEDIPEKNETKENITEEDVTEEEKPKRSLFGKLKEKLTTKTITPEKFEDLFWELELTLLENNVSILVIEKIKDNLREELVNKPLPKNVLGKINEVLTETLNEVLTFDKVDLTKLIDAKKKENKPFIITLFGINGSGKTTSVAKLAHYLQEKNYTVVMAACDTFRAAAIQQLEDHANNLNVKMIKHDYGSDSAAVAYDAVQYAQKNKVDVVLIDTAGRLHSNTNLMAELEKVVRVNSPDLKIFVGESITGNDCVEQAEKFNETLEVDGIILTKADIDEMGGAPLSIAYTIKKPILFLGMGQRYEDFEEFNKEKILKRLGFE
jgi:fused signal recognition particle receptor